MAGWIAILITGRNDKQGCMLNIIDGVIGAAIGGAIVGIFGGDDVIAFNLRSLLVAVLGAVVLLAIVNLIFRR